MLLHYGAVRYVFVGRLFAPGMAEAAFATVGGVKICHQVKFCLNHWHKDHLRDTLARFNGEAVLTTVPDGNHQLTLIVGVDQANQVAQHNAMLMAKARAWQDDCRQRRVSNVNGQARRDQGGGTRSQFYGVIETGAQVKSAEPEVA